MPVPDSVVELVRRYKDNYAQHRRSQYNETLTRVDFVNPLFEALGWDINNSQGLPETYRQVIHEDAIKIGGTTKAPDYSFRLGGQRKFFVETKKPTVNINLNREPAYQLRRYAWTATLPVSLLTNFEEFAVYDGRLAPGKDDSPKKARLDFFKYTDYLDRWDEIAARFSREAVVSGAFDQYTAEAADLFRGKLRVDAAFLQVIEHWRASLAADIAQSNRSLGPRALNSAVQIVIDRIIFLRICEDRGVETEYRLQPLLNGARVYPRLLELFHHADARYNSGLFHFQPEKGRGQPEDVTPRLTLSDRPLKELIASLYYPDSPFEFSVFPADILGQVYEQFLGKVIRVDGKTAVVEDKPEVKKAGGVYYTPTYIVNYIVAQTVGELLQGKTPRQAAGLKILDPACGSGSFLIGAYQFLLDWHEKWYVENGSEKWTKGKSAALYQGPGGAWRLTTAEKKRILLNNLYGVDIDAQAVEVTKLSLLLKVLEGESTETVNSNLKLFKERALPDLDANIKCGNSLIGSDFYDGQDMARFDTETQLRINAFDWETEFPGIMKAGGFDAVIGNPPYYKVSGLSNPVEMAYFKRRYLSGTYKTELYALFAEQSLALLNKKGLHSFIVPNSFLAGVYLRPLRSLLAQSHALVELVLLKDVKVFQDAKLDSVVYVVQNSKPAADATAVLRMVDQSLVTKTDSLQHLKLAEWLRTAGLEFRVTNNSQTAELFQRFRKPTICLSDVASVHLGLVLQSNSLLDSSQSKTKPDGILLGRDIDRYGKPAETRYFSFENDPIVGGTKNPNVYASGPRLVFQAIRNLKLQRRLIGTMVPANTFTMGTVHNIITHKSVTAAYLLGILSSNLLNLFYSGSFPEHRIKGAYLESLPIPAIDFDDPADKAQHDKMVSLVERMLTLHRELPTKSGQERVLTQRQIAATDRQIDALVYNLYGLTEDEIKIVEGQA